MQTTKEILNEAITLHGSLAAVSRVTRLTESTLKRIRNGRSKDCHPKTIGLLVKAARGDGPAGGGP